MADLAPIICPDHGTVAPSRGIAGWHRTHPDAPYAYHLRPLMCPECGRTCGYEAAPEPKNDRRAS